MIYVTIDTMKSVNTHLSLAPVVVRRAAVPPRNPPVEESVASTPDRVTLPASGPAKETKAAPTAGAGLFDPLSFCMIPYAVCLGTMAGALSTAMQMHQKLYAAAMAPTAKPNTVTLPPPAPPACTPHHVEVVKRFESKRWAWIERLHDADPHFKAPHYLKCQEQTDPELVADFGTPRPHNGDVLLHYAGDPPPGVPKHPIPIVLVPGATRTANFWTREGDSPDGQAPDGPGWTETLRERGYTVFSLTFAKSHEDNIQCAQQIANVIERVRQVTGAPQVDLVAHSKGTIPSRVYATPGMHEAWMSGFKNDVRRLIELGGPNGGLDLSYRHPVDNIAVASGEVNAPSSSETMFGMPSSRKNSFAHDGMDAFPGQRQMLRSWVNQYPLAMDEEDWATTYFGGQGFVSSSRGIQAAIEDSGHFMERLMQSPFDPSVQVAVLAGTRPDVSGVLNEYTGPSDGLVFVDSALKLPAGTQVIAARAMPLNHMELARDESALNWVDNVLANPSPTALTTADLDKITDEARKSGYDQLALTTLTPGGMLNALLRRHT